MASTPIILRYRRGDAWVDAKLEVDRSCTVEVFKVQVFSLTGVTPEDQRIYIEGNPLRDSVKMGEVGWTTDKPVVMTAAQSSTSRGVDLEQRNPSPVNSKASSNVKPDGNNDNYHALRSTSSANTWLRLFRRFRRPIDTNAGGEVQVNDRAKVAILDSGIDMSNPKILLQDRKRIKGTRSFLREGAENDTDDTHSHRHGTQIALLLLKGAPFADVYIARVKEDEGSSLRPESVAKAIKYATEEWKVDIISMSWGFTSEYAPVADAIRRASKEGKIMFVAASNNGANLPNEMEVAFPANMSDIICISSADGYGNPSSFSPPQRKGYYNFSTLGEAVPEACDPKRGSGQRYTGTSFATPLAAAIAASFIEFTRQGRFGNYKIADALKKEVRTRQGILKILVAVSRESQGFNYLQPWSLLQCMSSAGKCPDKCRRKRETAGRKLSNILQDILLNPEELETITSAPRLLHVIAADARASVHEYKPTCLAGTRVELQHRITEWITGESKQCVCWISGRYGTGKSTIARTIALRYAEQEQLGGTFFFSRNVTDLSTLSKFVSSLAHQLGLISPSLRFSVATRKRENHEVEQMVMRIQWEQLIQQPLSELKDWHSPIVFVIDALDECRGLGKAKLMEMIDLFLSTAVLPNVKVHFLITSRPEHYILSALGEFPQSVNHIVLDQVDRHSIAQDIRRLFQAELGSLHSERRGVPAEWLTEDTLTKLTEEADGLFIYAATVSRYIKGLGGDEAISIKKRLLRAFQGKGVNALNKTYSYILAQAVVVGGERMKKKTNKKKKKKNALKEQLKMLLGVIVALYEPMPERHLGEMCPQELEADVVSSRLDPLQSVLAIPPSQSGKDPVSISHKSFREFLQRRNGQGQTIWINQQAHRDLFTTCLRILSHHRTYRLKRDICNVRHPGIPVSQISQTKLKKCITIPTSYACRHLFDHLHELEPHQRRASGLYDNGVVHDFLRAHLLHWLEALSFMGVTIAAVHAINLLSSMVDAGQCPQLHAFVKDAERFILHSRVIIEEVPLQIYCSCLVFAPQQSLVRKAFAHEMPAWIARLPKVPPTWTLLRQTLGSHWLLSVMNSDLLDLEFSQDGQLVVSTIQLHGLQVWATATGARLFEVDAAGTAVAFSPRTKLVASAKSGVIELLDAANGTPIRSIVRKSDSPLDRVAFSPDGSRVLTGAATGEVELLDAGTGELLQSFKPGKHSQWLGTLQLTCSSNNKWVVATSRTDRSWNSKDFTMCLWDADNGSIVYENFYIGDPSGHVSFSPAGNLLAFIAYQEALVLDVANRVILHISECSLAAFSPDGRLATVTKDGSQAQLRDVVTAEKTSIIQLPAPFITARDIKLSADGRLLMLLSNERNGETMPVWDTTTGDFLGNVDDNPKPWGLAALSPDGTRIASWSSDGVVRLWDVPSATSRASPHLRRRKFHTALAISPDNRLLVSGGDHHPLTFWDLQTTAELLRTNDKISGVGDRLVFWPNAKLMLCETAGELKSWDTVALRPVRTFGSSLTHNMAISANGQTIVTAHLLPGDGYFYKISLHDVEGAQPSRILQNHIGWIQAVAFSPDGKVVATAGEPEITFWDVVTGKALDKVPLRRDGHTLSVVFSTDEDRLLLLRKDKGVKGKLRLVDIRLDKESTKRMAYSYGLDQCVATQLFSGSTRGGYIMTNCGPLCVPRTPETDADPPADLVHLYLTDSWVTYEGYNLLWIPHAYRYDDEDRVQRDLIAVRDQFVVFEAIPGEIIFMEFELDEMPRMPDDIEI